MNKLKLVFLLCFFNVLSLKSQDVWNVYNEQNSDLPNNTVRVLAVDHQNRKWVGTDYGLGMYNDTSWTVYNSSNSGLTDNTIRSLYIDMQNRVWVGTMSGGLSLFDGQNWTNYNPTNSGIPDYYVRAIAVDSLGRKWIGTVEGLVMYNDTTWRIWTTDNSALFSNNISSLKVGRDNRITAGTINGGVIYAYDTVLTVYTRNNGSGIPDNSVSQIVIDSSDNYWFSSPAGGVFADYGGPYWLMYNMDNSGIPANAATCIFIDDADRQYIGTEQHGVAKRVMPNSWSYYHSGNSSLPDDNIHALIKDQNGVLWIGTHQEGLVSLLEDPAPIREIERNSKKILIFPNPTSDYLYLSLPNIAEADIVVFNALGESLAVNISIENNQIKLDLKGFNSGIYHISIKGENESFSSNFVVETNK
jgi:ligand-binding sensor domain-containing protein